MREAGFTTPPDRETAIVFTVRDITGIIDCINNVDPVDVLEQIAISLPETKEFIVLNGIELDSPYTYNKLRNFAFLPSGLIETLPKQTEYVTPTIAKLWKDLWPIIQNRTCDVARKLFCASYASTKPGNDNDQENLKSLLDNGKVNKKALYNLMDSAEQIKCTDRDMSRTWSTRPAPDITETRDQTLDKEIKTRKVLPGKCSYSLLWKGERTLCKRNYHVDPRYENKRFQNYEKRKSVIYITEESLKRLSEIERNRDMDETPTRNIETIPRRLTFSEKKAVEENLFRRYKNFENWNPKLVITKIVDSKLLRIWNTAFRVYQRNITTTLSRRGRNLLDTIECITLMELQDRHTDKNHSIWQTLDSRNGKITDEEMILWHNAFKSIVKNAISHSKGIENEYLLNTIEHGISCRQAISQKSQIGKMLPYQLISKMFGMDHEWTNPIKYQINSTLWIIENLGRRDTDIWEPKKYTIHEIARSNQKQTQNKTFASVPAAEFTCYKGNKNCTARIFSWFNPDPNDLRIACSVLCDEESESESTNSENEHTAERNSESQESDSTLPTLEDLNPSSLSNPESSQQETSSSSLECIIIQQATKRTWSEANKDVEKETRNTKRREN